VNLLTNLVNCMAILRGVWTHSTYSGDAGTIFIKKRVIR